MKHRNLLLSLRHRALLTSTAALVSSGCGVLPEEILQSGFETPHGEHFGSNPSALQRFGSCDDLLTSLQERSLDSLLLRAEQLRTAPTNFYGEPGIFIDNVGSAVEESALGSPAGPVSNTIGAEGDRVQVTSGTSSAAPASSFSNTTVQVEGIDEADIVKADGNAILLLQGDVLFRAQAWPVEDLEITGAAVLEGYPREMHVHDGMALVYSQVYRNLQQEANSDSQLRPYDNGYGEFTKLTLLDISGDEPVVVRESYLDGYYQSSRRHGDTVRTVVDNRYRIPNFDNFYLEYFTPFGQPYRQQDIDAQVDAWLERSSWAITESELSDWLPQHFERVDGELTAVPVDCSNYFEPETNLNSSERGSTGVTSVTALSLEGGAYAPLNTTSFLGTASRVYSNESVMVLTSSEYLYSDQGYSQTTTLHRFNIDDMDTPYVASGIVPGALNNQFSLDEYEGVIRVSTTDNSRLVSEGPQGQEPENRVFTLGTDGAWLDILGQTGAFGLNEEIYATRFLGNRAYVVTFRQIDPLFVVDLADPTNPQVVGELEIPGFSNYLFPLGEDHLFAIGRDATEEGRTQGVALQIFDVSDPSAPSLAHRYVYDSEDGNTSVQIDHRGLAFDPNSDRLAFPLQTYTNTGRVSSLEVFSVDPIDGFERLGDLSPVRAELSFEECLREMGWTLERFEESYGSSPEELQLMTEVFQQECSYFVNRESVQRGLFREDVVFAVTNASVLAQSLDALGSAPLAAVGLPNPYGGYGGGAMVPGLGMGGRSMVVEGTMSPVPPPRGGTAGSVMPGGTGGASSSGDTGGSEAGAAMSEPE